ncbi:MAG: hypothetical protein ACYSUR_16295, partial [Planctomycetota bacterium]
MPVTEPVLTKRIPTPPWGDPKDRHLVGYDEYVASGGYEMLAKARGGRRYLTLNCDEAEPCTFKDRLLIDFDPHLVLEGMAITCYACRLDTA